MTAFGSLVWINLAIAAVAIWRARPGTLILAGNSLVACQALDNIQAFGQPSSEQYLPASLFSIPQLEIAWNIMAIVAGMLTISVCWPARRRPNLDPTSLPALPPWLLATFAVYVAVAIVSSRTIATEGYIGSAWTIAGVNLGGGNAFILSLILYELYRRTLIGQVKPWLGFAFMLGLLTATDYSKGSTGLASGYAVTAGVIILSSSKGGALRKTVLSASAILLVAILAHVIREVRQDLAERGGSTILRAVNNLAAADAHTKQTSEGVETGGNGTQYACHLLECIQLYEAGLDRQWRSVYNPLLFTFEPSFLQRPLGFLRPLDAPAELYQYYIHGGGIYTPGDLYWNGGYLCLILVGAALVWMAFACDVRLRTSWFWLMMACHFLPGLLQGLGYGFAQVARGAFNGLLAMFVYYFYRVVLGRSGARRLRGVPPPTLLRVGARGRS